MFLKTWPILAIACIIGALVLAEAKQQDEWRLRPRQHKISKEAEEDKLEMEADHTEEDMIEVVEPYKTLIQLTTRQILTQADISKHVDVDVAMSIINEVFSMLSKPTNLMIVVEVMAVFAVASIGVSLLFPDAQKQLEMVWNDPSKTLRHFSNGLSEKPIRLMLESSTDKMLSRLGMKEEACRLQTICKIGQETHLKLPPLPKVARKFINKHKIWHSLKSNKYVATFMAGYNSNCVAFNVRAKDNNCLVNIIEQSLKHMQQIFAKFTYSTS